MCSKFGDYSRFDSQHNWGDQYIHSRRKRIILNLITTKISICALKIMRKMAMTSELDSLIISY